MKTIALLLLLVVGLTSAEARIGETLEQCIARYGQPLAPPNADGLYTFDKDGFLIAASFFEGHAEYLMISKGIPGTPSAGRLSDNEIAILMNANGGGKQWKQGPKIDENDEWVTEDGQLHALRVAKLGALIFSTQQRNERRHAEREKKDATTLRGF